MRPKYGRNKNHHPWEWPFEQNKLLPASPISQVASVREIFDWGSSSQSSDTIDTSIPPYTREMTFPCTSTLGNNSNLLLEGHSTAFWPKEAAQGSNTAIAGASYSGSGQNWWEDYPPTSHGRFLPAQQTLISHDGLPRYCNDNAPNLWHYGSELCATQMIAINQPQSIRFDAPLAMSTSGSSQGSSYGSYAVSSSGNSSHDGEAESSTMQHDSRGEASCSSQELQSDFLHTRPPKRHAPILLSSDRTHGDDEEAESQPKKNETQSTMSDPPVSCYTDGYAASSRHNLKLGKRKRTRHSRDASTKLALTDVKRQDRSEKDIFLVQSKLAGMSYKEIRRKGNFTEAESTLRGRYRTLTKHKAARVRKPEWYDNDVGGLAGS